MIECSKCSTVTSLEDLFRDKAVEKDLIEVSFPCTHEHCTWQGKNLEYRVSCSTERQLMLDYNFLLQDHLASCGYKMVKCPNSCGVELTRRELEGHIISCPSKPLLCEWCEKEVPRNKVDVSKLVLCNAMHNFIATYLLCRSTSERHVMVSE